MKSNEQVNGHKLKLQLSYSRFRKFERDSTPHSSGNFSKA